jgi:hypothetical protein
MRPSAHFRSAFVAGLAVLIGTAAGAGIASAVSPSLAGESFRAQTADINDGPGTVTILSRSCDEDGGRITFEAAGEAAGPYPGTFEEHGTIETAQPPNVPGPGARISTTFSIDSVLGDVQGTKSAFLPGEGLCYEDRVGDVFEDFFHGDAVLLYEATITTATGTSTDRGVASLSLTYSRYAVDAPVLPALRGTELASMAEFFLMSLPQSTVDCKRGGFGDYEVNGIGIFKNQGDCVSFVETGGRNPPSPNLP